MIAGRLLHGNDHRLLLADVQRTGSALERMQGLLAHPPLTTGQGLLLDHCAAIHTIGMHYTIDVIFLDRRLRVRKFVSDLKPQRIAWAWGASMVVEMLAGSLQTLGLREGDQLLWEESV